MMTMKPIRVEAARTRLLNSLAVLGTQYRLIRLLVRLIVRFTH